MSLKQPPMRRPADTPERPITDRQCVAARTLLGWDQQHLANAAGVSRSTVQSFEKGTGTTRPKMIYRMMAAFTAAGIRFLYGGPGVQIVEASRHQEPGLMPSHDPMALNAYAALSNRPAAWLLATAPNGPWRLVTDLRPSGEQGSYDVTWVMPHGDAWTLPTVARLPPDHIVFVARSDLETPTAVL